MQSAHLATGQRCLSIAAARGIIGSKSALYKGRLTPASSTRSLTGRARTSLRINAVLQERPTVPKTGDEQASKSGGQKQGRRKVDGVIVVSKRKQWGAVQLEAILIDQNGNRSGPASATILTPPFSEAERRFNLSFDVSDEFDKVAALRVEPKLSVSGQHDKSVFLDRVETTDSQAGTKTIVWCHSWVSQNQGGRMFFSNEASLVQSNSEELKKLREQELRDIKGEKWVADSSGSGGSWKEDLGMRQPLERIYQYQVYDDMSEPGYDPKKPDADEKVRPVLGKDPNNPEGAGPYCYPRRLATHRPYLPNTGKEIYTSDPYLPLDERFDERKSIAFGFNTAFSLLPWLVEQILPWRRMRELTGFDDVAFMYQNAWRALLSWLFLVPGLPKLLRLNQEVLPPLPLVAFGRSTLWDDDTEFGRQVVAGVNPCALEAVTDYAEFTKRSTLSDQHVKGLLEHPTLKEAIEDPDRNIFVIDHATTLLSTLTPTDKSPIVEQINNLRPDEVFMYAPRCLLHKSKAGRLTPIAIELCLPHEEPLIITANDDPLRWRLAKGHFLAANSGHHQVISHFLRTHACIEPIIIATTRCLSVMHPLNKALHPHLRFTLAINAARARTGLINGAGVIETCFNPGKVAMTMSARIYADWRFEDQALPADLLKRKMLVEDSAGDIKWKGKTYSIVMGEDYPYAADGMLLWNSMHDWLTGYLGTYYQSQADLDNDTELHAWWDEIKHKGHPDISEGWPELKTLQDVADIGTTITWLASGHHAAVNFGQYAYTGYFPNFPTISRQRIPPVGTHEWEEMCEDHDLAFLRTFSDKKTALQVLGVVRLLSTHDAEEEYLATRPDDATWTSSKVDRGHWEGFQKSVQMAEAEIKRRNNDPNLKHRYMKYELLMPDLGPKPKYHCGPPARGVPNSISI